MPELPEVETLRRDLVHNILGCTIEGVEVTNLRSIRPHLSPGEFISPLTHSTFQSVYRKGKYLAMVVQTEDKHSSVLVAHMGMSGQLRLFDTGAELPKHSHVMLLLSNQKTLTFVDPRTFGKMYIDPQDEFGNSQTFNRIGVDPICESEKLLSTISSYRKSSIGVKWLMLNQSLVSGIGNMYADEILFRSGIRFDRPGSTLTNEEIHGLSKTITELLSAAIEARGSSLKDMQYRDVAGEIGSFQRLHLAYGREGEDCLRCGDKLVRIVSKGRSSFLCPGCQH